MKVRTQEYNSQKTEVPNMKDFRLFTDSEFLKKITEIFFICFLGVVSISILFSLPFLYFISGLGVLLGITGHIFLGKAFFGKQENYFKQGRLDQELKEVINDKNLYHHWNFRREIGIETKFKKFLFFDLISIKIILFFVFFILLSLIFPPKIIIFPYILTIPLYMRDFISFHFQRKKYQVIILRENPQSYYWNKHTLYLY